MHGGVLSAVLLAIAELGPNDGYQRGAVAGLELAPEYAALEVGAVNLSAQRTSCVATLFAADGSEVGRTAFEVEALGWGRRDAAVESGGRRATYAQVSCDRTFYPIAATTPADGGGVELAKGIGPNGACTEKMTLVRAADGKYVLDRPGLFHQATTARPKGILCVRAPSQLKVARARFEWDIYPGNWSARDRSGIHNLGYFFLDRYRSGVVGNVNAIGPNKDRIKWMQNVGMAVCGSGQPCNTTGTRSHRLEANRIYHLIYVFDAAAKTVTLTLQDSGRTTLATVSGTTAGGRTLSVTPYGKGELDGVAMVMEFGNYLGQAPPEEATIGWLYGNVRVEMTLGN
jgi:hypothetical protein